MVWITGTATGHLDMFSKLRTHITANGWTVFDYVTAGAAPNQYSMQCKGPGMGVGYETHFCMRTFANPSSNEYCFEMNGTTDYVSGLGWDDQPGKSPQSIFMRLWNSTMPYWLSITNRRILLVIKASNTYHSMHMGFFLPFANPVEYPYPFYMASDASYIGTFAEVGANVRSIANPGRNGAFVREPGGVWRSVACNLDADSQYRSIDNSGYTMWPYLSPSNTSQHNVFNGSQPPQIRMREAPNIPDSLPMVNVHIVGCADNLGVLGTVEGLFWFTGIGVSAEQTIVNSGQNHKVFIAINRSGENPAQSYAVLEG